MGQINATGMALVYACYPCVQSCFTVVSFYSKCVTAWTMNFMVTLIISHFAVCTGISLSNLYFILNLDKYILR